MSAFDAEEHGSVAPGNSRATRITQSTLHRFFSQQPPKINTNNQPQHPVNRPDLVQQHECENIEYTTTTNYQNQNKNTPQIARDSQTANTNNLFPSIENANISNISTTQTQQTPIPQNNKTEGTSIPPDKFWGHPLRPKQKHIFRLLYQNLHGLKFFGQKLSAQDTFRQTRNAEIDCFCWAETNINWRHQHFTTQLQNQAKRIWKHCKIATSSALLPEQQVSKLPGGTAIGITGQVASRLITSGQDSHDMGRWSYITIRAKENRRITIFCGYRPCKQSTTEGILTANQQQRTLLHREDRPINPRKAFIQDLTTAIVQRIGQGEEIIIAFDANEGLQLSSSQVLQLMEETNLVNIMDLTCDPDTPQNTHQTGTYPIDFILMSPSLVSAVKYAGTTELHKVYRSDHRALWVDFDARLLFGTHQPNESGNPQRGLCITSGRSLDTYNTKLKDALLRKHISRRQLELTEMIQSKSIPADEISRVATGIDTDITRAMKFAERCCPIILQTPWSPKLHNTKMLIKFWRKCIHLCQRGKEVTSLELSDRDRISWSEQDPPDLTQMRDLRYCRRAYKKAVKLCKIQTSDAAELRRQHLEERARYLFGEDEPDLAKIVRRIAKTEEIKSVWRHLKLGIGAKQKSEYDTLLVDYPTPNTQLFDPQEIAAALQHRNQHHFHQAEGTPFTHPEIVAQTGRFGELGITSLQSIPTELDSESLSALLTELRETSLPTFTSEISAAEIKSGLKRWNPQTLTSPSGRGLPHYHAIMRESASKLRNRNEDIIFPTMATLWSASVNTGFGLPRWNKVVNFMIPKAPGNFHVSKARVIHLLEADLNLFLGILYDKRLQQSAKTHNRLHPLQFGAIKARNSTDPIMLKTINLALAGLTGTTLITVENDCSAAFDRLVQNYANLAAQNLGLSPSISALFKNIHENTKFYVRTAHGDSSTKYTNTTERYLHGTAQGGKFSPSLYVLSMMPAMNIIKKQAEGAEFWDPFRSICSAISQVSFIDDTSNISNNFLYELQSQSLYSELRRKQSVSNNISRVTSLTQLWERLVWATGGKLEITKCFGILYSHSFLATGQPTLVSVPSNADIQVQSSETGLQTTIPWLPQTGHCKTLGVEINPTGSTKHEYERLLKKSRELANRTRLAINMTRKQAQLTYNAHFMGSIGYSLITTNFSEAQMTKLSGPFLAAILPKLGFNRSFPRQVTHGHTAYGGLGLKDLFTEQGTKQIAFLLQHLRAQKGTVFDHIRIYLSWSQRYCGVSTAILEGTHVAIPQLPDGWISNVRKFLQKVNCRLTVPYQHSMQPRRLHDRPIMDDVAAAYQAGLLTRWKVKAINWVRLFLKVEYLSDISNQEGTHWLAACAAGKFLSPEKLESKPTALWPIQGEPNFRAIKEFRTFITRTYCQQSTELTQHLGAWLPGHQNREFMTYVDIARKMVYHKGRDKWQQWTFGRGDTGQVRLGQRLPDTDGPISGQPGRLIRELNMVVFSQEETSGANENLFAHPNLITRNSIFHQVRTSVRLSLRLNELVGMSTPEPKIEVYTTAHEFHITHIPTGEILLRVQLHDTTQATPTRRSAWTVACAVEAVRTHLPRTNRGHLLLSLCISNFSIMHQVSKLLKHAEVHANSYLGESIDVLRTTVDTMRELADSGKVRWEITQKQVQPDCINHFSDEIQHITGRLNHPIEGVGAYLWHANQPVHSSPLKFIRESEAKRRMEEYFQEKYKWTVDTREMVDWQIFQAASIKLSHKRFLTRLLTRWLPTNARMYTIDGISAKCPWCEADEDITHLYCCPSRQLWRTNLINSVTDKFSPHLSSSTIAGLTFCLRSALGLPVGEQPYHPAVASQERIGYQNLLLGFVSREWLQTENRQPVKLRRQISKMVTFFWTELHNLWKDRCLLITNRPRSPHSYPRAQLLERIHILFEVASGLLEQDRTVILNKTLPDLHQLSTAQLKIWYATAKKSVSLARRRRQLRDLRLSIS